ncbi:MAG: PAS domain-containing sensor histidine kinase [Deltaproteobacteria bacterium]|nr:PAS domain-containing sensor histidine kinase [Deltaproteobacteria bacterium]
MPDAILVVDGAGRILMGNGEAGRVFRREPRSLSGESIEAFVPERLRAMHAAARGFYAAAPKVRPMAAPALNLVALRSDGTEFPAEISLNPVETDQGVWTIAEIRDLTDRRHAGEQTCVEPADGDTRSRDQFLEAASHELRTPLAALQLQLELLQRTLRRVGASPMHPAIGDAVARAIRYANRTRDLAVGLLDVARLARRALELELEPVDLAAVLRETRDELAAAAAEAGSELSVGGAATLTGWWDRARIRQLLFHLAENAIKFGGGHPVRLEVWREGDRARLSVVDGGIGIAAADLHRIFGKYERAVPSGRYPGFGVGLFVVRCVAEAHGGTVAVVSTTGRGSRFDVELPLRPAARGGQAPRMEEGA